MAYMAFCEVSQDQSAGTPAAADDFGFKVLTSSDPAEKTKKLSAELANGRLAMMAIIGMFFQARWGVWRQCPSGICVSCVSCTNSRIFLWRVEQSRFDVMSRLRCRMPLHVCIYVYMYICMYVMSVCLYVCMICMSVCLYVCLSVSLPVCMSACPYVCMSVCPHVCMSVLSLMYVCICNVISCHVIWCNVL